MSTKITLLANATIYGIGERTSHNLVATAGQTNQGWPVMSNGATYEIWHPDGREMVIDINGAIDAAALVLTVTSPPQTDLHRFAYLMERFDYAAREHLLAQQNGSTEELRDAQTHYIDERQRLWQAIGEMNALLELGTEVMREQTDGIIAMADAVKFAIPDSPEKDALMAKLDAIRPPRPN